ncbi:MAG: helix-turn-helix domain-containing protein [Alphaproteobacteria bacterium]
MTQDKKEENLSDGVQAEETQETVGALLRKTRLAKKQDLRDIASYLCIRYQFLEALEENRYKELPGEAYANGFIRSYAAYLGLDPADIIMRYKQEFFAQAREEKRGLNMSEEETENMTPAPKVLLFSLILLLAAYGLWQSFSGQEETLPPVAAETVDSITVVEQSYPLPQETNETAEPASIAAEAVLPPVPPVKPEYRPEKESVEVVEETAAQSLSSAEPMTVVSVQPVPVQTMSAETEPVQTIRVYGQKNYNPRLVLVAAEETWIEITRNNEIVFSRLLNKGDRYQVSSFKPEELFLKTGNAGGLEIYCDGQLTQSLGPHGALRSNIALIPDDFAAKIVENIE